MMCEDLFARQNIQHKNDKDKMSSTIGMVKIEPKNAVKIEPRLKTQSRGGEVVKLPFYFKWQL